ncbi:MAG: hypothetical protein NC483_00965 [Ruminococcus sp.]|nr:hypothetical protein [Ruminococcus sp.]
MKIYENYIDKNTGFCGDRQPSSNLSIINNIGGYNDITTIYGSRTRVFPNGSVAENVNPSFKCQNANDYYTVKESNTGNKSLTNPIGLITADEVSYAGMVVSGRKVTKINYLYTEKTYWTMTPDYYNKGTNKSSIFRVFFDGHLDSDGLNITHGIRPVINLRSDITLTGDGTQSNPYKIID